MTVLPVPSQLRSLIYDLAERLAKLPALGALRRQIPACPSSFGGFLFGVWHFEPNARWCPGRHRCI
jgi:hypothetical protein